MPTVRACTGGNISTLSREEELNVGKKGEKKGEGRKSSRMESAALCCCCCNNRFRWLVAFGSTVDFFAIPPSPLYRYLFVFGKVRLLSAWWRGRTTPWRREIELAFQPSVCGTRQLYVLVCEASTRGTVRCSVYVRKFEIIGVLAARLRREDSPLIR